ncbi:TPA: BMP family ABC transporter substrate-binding protein, partial [Candidatus Bathyarchaeota archaeon]|nr:BMP family ABC transporter substrate-binding protein [Candidatus Bathyarchaeota archaeon]
MERLRRDVKGLTRLAMVPLIIAVAVISSVCTYFAVPPKERVVEVPVVERLRAAWVYIGPIGDYGWTYAHNLGREYADERLQWLETKYLEAIPYADAPRILDELVAEGYEVIFTTSFGYMDPTIEAGNRHPDVIFMHCSGYKRSKNVGTYFLKMYEPYYLCGLAAGAVTKTGKIGYIPACTIPEVVRHINAFVIGAVEGARKAYELGLKESAEVEVYVTPPLGFWVDPEKAKEAAVALIETRDCDTLAFTEDTPAVLEAAQEYYERWEAEEWGYPVYSFSHYSDMSEWGPNACLMGQI